MMNMFRNFMVRFSNTNKWLLNYQTRKQKERQLRLSGILENELGIEFYTVEGLKELVNNLRTIKPSSRCHVIGSGWSLNETSKFISDDDFVIGFNQAAISGIRFDLYFVEFGSQQELEISEKQFKLIKEVVSEQTDLIFFKNVWARRNNLDYIRKNWANHVHYIQDIPTNCYNPRFLRQSLDIFLKDDPIFMRQYSSTALTMIKLGKDLGFKKIILHGVDFGGEYFFDTTDFEDENNLRKYLPSRKSNNIYIKSGKQDIHSTSKDLFGLKYSLPYVNEYMVAKDVNLYAATSNSPLSKILPVYQEYE